MMKSTYKVRYQSLNRGSYYDRFVNHRIGDHITTDLSIIESGIILRPICQSLNRGSYYDRFVNH